MFPQYVAGCSSCEGLIAASRSQGGGLGQVMCLLREDSDRLAPHRTQAVETSYGGASGAIPAVVPQEYRSRGCQKAVSFLPLASLHSQRLARPRQKKSFMWMNPLFRSNRPIPASTSDPTGQARGPTRSRACPIRRMGGTWPPGVKAFADPGRGPYGRAA